MGESLPSRDWWSLLIGRLGITIFSLIGDCTSAVQFLKELVRISAQASSSSISNLLIATKFSYEVEIKFFTGLQKSDAI
jgi:hypothetical protein